MLGETAFGTYATLKTAFDQNAVGRINTFQFYSQVKWGAVGWEFGLKTVVVHVMPPNGAEGHRSGKFWTCPSILTLYYSYYHIIHKMSHIMKIAALDIYLFSPREKRALGVLSEITVPFLSVYIL
jgi:hypothetical protein